MKIANKRVYWTGLMCTINLLVLTLGLQGSASHKKIARREKSLQERLDTAQAMQSDSAASLAKNQIMQEQVRKRLEKSTSQKSREQGQKVLQDLQATAETVRQEMARNSADINNLEARIAGIALRQAPQGALPGIQETEQEEAP